jgi:Ca2+-binding EF-hand superfamily protein
MELLDDEGDFVDAALKVFEEIFQRFDQDKDGALNDTELDAFATVKSLRKLCTYL